MKTKKTSPKQSCGNWRNIQCFQTVCAVLPSLGFDQCEASRDRDLREASEVDAMLSSCVRAPVSTAAVLRRDGAAAFPKPL